MVEVSPKISGLKAWYIALVVFSGIGLFISVIYETPFNKRLMFVGFLGLFLIGIGEWSCVGTLIRPYGTGLLSIKGWRKWRPLGLVFYIVGIMLIVLVLLHILGLTNILFEIP